MTREPLGARVVNIGFGNIASVARIVTIVAPDSAPIKRLKEDAQKRGKLIDATQGRKTRSVIITDSDHVILSALQVETITQRLMAVHVDISGEISNTADN